MNLIALVAFAGLASATEPIYYNRTVEDQRDVGSINENFRTGADSARRSDLTNGGAVSGDITVTGDIIIRGSGNGITFADSSTQTVAASSSSYTSIMLTASAPTGVSTPTINTLYASNINQAFAVFVTSNAAAVLQYSVGVTSVTYTAEGRYIVNWQRPFVNIFYHRSITTEIGTTGHNQCMVNSDTPLSVSMVSIFCTSAGPAFQNPSKVFVMATGAQ